jgi:hypothetical protein
MDGAKFETAIRRLPGVEAARVVMSGRDPAEIHVLAGPGKPAKQVVRDIQSLAMAAFGHPLDRRIVSVVQLDDPELLGGDRPAIEDVSEYIDGSHLEATVTLAWQDRQLVGRATGPASATTRLRLIAEATVGALAQALSEHAAFAVAAVDTPKVGTREVAVAMVVIVSDGEERIVVGSALVQADSSRAVVRAVLDALNRHIPGLRR